MAAMVRRYRVVEVIAGKHCDVRPGFNNYEDAWSRLLQVEGPAYIQDMHTKGRRVVARNDALKLRGLIR